MSDAEGVDSGKSVTDADTTVLATGKTLDIVSAVVTPSVVNTFGTDDQTAELRLVVDGGNNTTALGDAVQAELTVLKFEVSSITEDGTITVFNSNGTEVGTATSDTSGTAATVTSSTAGDLLATADTAGIAANGSTVTIVTGGADATGVIISAETATTITATIETDGAGAADPTWSDVVTALNLAGTFGATITSPANGADAVLAGDAQTMTLAGGVAGTTSDTVTVTLGAADSIGNDNETYRVQTTIEGIVRLAKDGVSYTINTNPGASTKLENTLEIGQYANSN